MEGKEGTKKRVAFSVCLLLLKEGNHGRKKKPTKTHSDGNDGDLCKFQGKEHLRMGETITRGFM